MEKARAFKAVSADLPEIVFSTLPGQPEKVIAIKPGMRGYFDIATRRTAEELNAALEVTKPQECAMVAGSMFGWDCPAADPLNYAADGRYIGK